VDVPSPVLAKKYPAGTGSRAGAGGEAADDRACGKWRRDYRISGTGKIDLHHLYRAMNFLGEELDDQSGAAPFSPVCTKDRIEELLFASRQNLFSGLELVFFDTTSICFEGQGGNIGQRGFSKDYRPDLSKISKRVARG